ncbi:hypothetical protein HBH42_217570 [Parastagonospora nodorum]|nr:hypothetical protein HBH42_217570 [Parastagonospora nodorum]
MLLCWTIKSLSISSADANVREEENKNCSSLYYSNSNSDTATRKTRIKARERKAKLDSPLDSNNYCLDSSPDINPKDNLKDEEVTTAKDLAREQKERLKALLNAKMRDSLSVRLIDAYILYFKELLSNNSRIFANAISIGKTRAIVLACNLSNLLALQFCFFSNSLLENIGRLIKEEAIEMRINTTNAISKALAAANKLVALQSYVLGGFIIVCSFRKVDKHIFRAYNTISVTAQRMIIRKGGSYIEKRAILLSNSVTSDRIYKIEDARNIIANVKHNASKHELSYKDILEKEGLNELEASRRVIFNCFKMQAIVFYPALTTLKAAYVKDLFTNLSKDYFLSIAAEDAAKAANILLPPKEVCAKILIGLYKLIVQAVTSYARRYYRALAEMCVGIIYFNLDSKLELKVLGKQDVKITS